MSALKKDDRECNEITIACTCCKQQKTRYRTKKTRDSLKQHTHKQKAPTHQTVTRNYNLQHTGVLHLQVTRQSSTIIQIATYRALSLQLKKELQNHEKKW